MSNQFDQHTNGLIRGADQSMRFCANFCLQLVLWRYLALFQALEQQEKARRTHQSMANAVDHGAQ